MKLLNELIKLSSHFAEFEQFKSDCNWTRTQNHLVLKRTLNHLAKLKSRPNLKVIKNNKLLIKTCLKSHDIT